VAEVILKPDVILEPLRRLDAAEVHEARQKKETAVDIEREEKRLAAEKERNSGSLPHQHHLTAPTGATA